MWLTQGMRSPLTPRLVALAAFAFMLVMNVLATTLPLNGQATNEISDRYDTLFAPIGFTFAIWGVIYLLLGVYTVVQLVADNAVIRTITPWFIASSLLNGAWIVAWHYEVLWGAAVIIAALLWTLIQINKETTATRTTLGSTVAIRIPFAVYFGWVTVATVANISALLVQWGLGDGFWLSAETWTIVVLVVAVAIGSVTALVNSSPSYALVLVWAFWGILSRHISPSEWMGAYPGVILATQILLPTLALVAVLALVRWVRQPVQPILSKRLGA
jgi:TspO/MBR family